MTSENETTIPICVTGEELSQLRRGIRQQMQHLFGSQRGTLDEKMHELCLAYSVYHKLKAAMVTLREKEKLGDD